MVTIQTVLESVKNYLPSADLERIARAFDFANEAHKNQKRFSGEPYIIHPLSVASILTDFHPDEDTIIAALLHDVVEDTEHTIEDIERNFGPQVKNLCWGMVKLSKVRSKLNDPQVNNLRKLFLAMAKDFRVVLLKLCDRLHNIKTLEFVRPEKRIRIAQETLNVYAPIAGRLGIYSLKTQLEDMCFKYTNPEAYTNIANQLIESEKWREQYIENAKKVIAENLRSEGISANVDGRVKSIYSIYRKMFKKEKNSLGEIFDIFAMRVVLPDIYKYGKEYTGHLYTALGVIHKNSTPLANRFKDYIAVPKINGYRSLHTTVMGLGPKDNPQPTEVQLRTESMHEYAEYGIAAHWMYEEVGSVNLAALDEVIKRYSDKKDPKDFEEALASSSVNFFKQHKAWIAGLGKASRNTKSNPELMEGLRVDVFSDRIFVLTPRGDVQDLPVGATPIDFAYAVHSDIGDTCVGAKVNGNIVPIDYALKNGEVVEIITRKNATPSQYWLSFVKTNHARSRIRSWFHGLDDDKNFKDGKEMVNEKLAQLGRPQLDEGLSLLKNIEGNKISLKDRQELISEVGRGALLPFALIKKILTLEEIIIGRKLFDPPKPRELKKIPAEQDLPKVLIDGEENMPYQFVRCCDASFADELVGYVTRGNGVSIHKRTCSVLQNMQDARMIPVSVTGGMRSYPVSIKVEADDRVGLMRDVSQVIGNNKINIIDFSVRAAQENRVDINVIVGINNFDQLDRMLYSLEKISSVRRAFKVN